MNVLNFFNTFADGNGTPAVPAAGYRLPRCTNQVELDRQLPKTVAAILGTDADVIGSTRSKTTAMAPKAPLRSWWTGSTRDRPGTYAFIDVDAGTGQINALGIDAIKVGLIYQPAKVTPVGKTAALNTVAFVNGGDSAPRNRPSLTQAFQVNATGARFWWTSTISRAKAGL